MRLQHKRWGNEQRQWSQRAYIPMKNKIYEADKEKNNRTIHQRWSKEKYSSIRYEIEGTVLCRIDRRRFLIKILFKYRTAGSEGQIETIFFRYGNQSIQFSTSTDSMSLEPNNFGS